MPNKKILVTYASRFGSTTGVADAIGKTLRDYDLDVEVIPMSEVKDLVAYDAVVAGSAINGGAWLPQAMQFVQEHQSDLGRKPLAIFLVCMTLSMRNGEKYRSHVSSWLAPVSELVRQKGKINNPISEGLFAGALDINKIPSFSDRLKFRISVLLGFWKEGDHRDWEAIRQWAASLPPLI